MTHYHITGNTYPIKDQLKQLGCRWDAGSKAWVTQSDEVYRKGLELVNGTGRMQTSSYRSLPPVQKPRVQKEDIRIEYPSRGATYRHDAYGVYRYDTYPRSSVLTGQQRRQFMDSFQTLEEAQKAFPGAELCGCGFQEPYINHLSNGPDWIE